MYSHNITSRQNISYTLSKKAALKYSQFLQKFDNGLPNIFTIIKSEKSEFNCAKTNINFKNKFIKELNFKGTTYKEEYFLTKNVSSVIELYEIVRILISDTKEIYFTTKEFFVCSFNEHYQSYEIGSLINNIKIININEFEGPPIHVQLCSLK